MMTNASSLKLLILTLFLLLIEACSNPYRIPGNLRKLRSSEVISMIRRNESIPRDVKILTEDGKPIDTTTIFLIGQEKLITDFYADSTNTIKLLILRPCEIKDKRLMDDIKKVNNESMFLEPLNVDCTKLSEILASIRNKDQESRTSKELKTVNSDKENQRLVFSIINKCGFPESSMNDASGLETIFLVIQHGSKEMRAKYLPNFIRLSDKGEFSKSMVALMEDRAMMDSGKKQKYGSQLLLSNGAWELYPVENLDSVNARRKSVGLNTLEEYLKEVGIKY